MSAGEWKDLYLAAVDGNLSLVQYQISQKVNPNYQHPEILRTPLVASLVEGHLEIAHYLLAHGADPGLVSELDGLTPLQVAKKHGHEEFVALFLRLGVKDPRRPFWWRWLPV